MKQGILIVFILLTLTSNGQDSNAIKPQINFDSLFLAKLNTAIGKSFPLFSVSHENRIFSNENLKGKIVFINFWFEACPPCIAEFAALNKLYDTLKDNQNVEFISFTFETIEKIKEITKAYHIRYKIFSIKQQDCYRLNQNNGFPTSIILDRKGIIKFINSGGNTDKEKATKIVLEIYYPEIIKESGNLLN